MIDTGRLDHVAILVGDSDKALGYFRDELGLPVVHAEVVEKIAVRLTYLDAGNAFIQLVEPLDPASALAGQLRERGEGLHHICFGVDDVLDTAGELAGGEAVTPGTGRGRLSAFVPGTRHGVLVELTESS